MVACTTTNFQGFISLIRPGYFLSRFNGLDNKRPGCYALTVKGTIPDYVLHESELEREMQGAGRRMRLRVVECTCSGDSNGGFRASDAQPGEGGTNNDPSRGGPSLLGPARVAAQSSSSRPPTRQPHVAARDQILLFRDFHSRHLRCVGSC